MLDDWRGIIGIHDRINHMHSGRTRPFLAVVMGAVAATGCWAPATSANDDVPGKPAPNQANAADQELEEITAKVRAGKIDEALGSLREKAAKHPEWSPAQLILARLLFVANQAVPGRRALEQAAIEAPEHPEVYLTFGSLAFTDGRLSDARLNFENALLLAGDGRGAADKMRAFRREAFAGLAAVAESREDWKLAENRLKALIELDPKNAIARQRLGGVLFRLGRTEDAFTSLTQAVKDNPALEPAGVSMAMLYSQKGDLKKAEEWFEYAQQAEPKSSRVHLARASWLLDHGRASAARPEVEEAVKLAPDSKESQRLRGLIAWHLRDLVASEQILEPLHREAPGDAAVANWLALSLVEQEDPAKRKRGLELAEVNALQFPRSHEVLATLGWALYRAGRPDQAGEKLRAAVTGVRTTADIAYFLARVMADKGQTEEARKYLESATKSPGAFAHRDDAKTLLKSLTK
jgi:Tfp pilus assembly protein PilF